MRHDSEPGHRQWGCGAGHLTTREIEVLRLAAAGLSSRVIARQLRISPRTVDDHLRVMRQRAGAADRAELIARAYAAEILLPGWPPRWSGKHCLLIRQTPAPDCSQAKITGVYATRSVNGPANARRMSQNSARNPARSNTIQARFLNTSGDDDKNQTPAAEGTVWQTARLPAGTGMLLGYARMDTRDYSLGQQIDALAAAGCHKIFADTEPGRHSQYPELRRLLDYARPGDALVVASLTRLSRSLHGLILLVAELQRHGVELAALHENLDTATPGGRQIFHVFAALADFSREPIAGSAPQRRRAAGAGGHAGRPTVMTAEKITTARALLPKNSIAAIARQIGVSRGTLYAHMDALTAGT
jgi:DNA invertase Pin-like site-specific DNA recombinase